MPIFQTKVKRLKLTFSPLSAEQMSNIGTVMVDSIKARIFRAQDTTDSKAKPLSARYALEKQKGRYVTGGGKQRYSGQPIRDWKMRGWTMASLKVKSATEEKVTIGFINPQADQIITIQNRLSKLWGVAPSDLEAQYAAVRATLQQVGTSQLIQITKVG